MTDKSFIGKVALVTGASGGIGGTIALKLSAAGAKVAVHYNKSQQKAEHVMESILATGGEAKLFAGNVSDAEQVKAMFQDIEKEWSSVDILVNNAGISGEKGVTTGNINRKNFLEVINVNCLSVVKLSDALLTNIEKSHEKNILVISSRMGSISDNERGRSYAYRTSKAALNCVMRSFAIDVNDKGINVMLIHPGWVKTSIGGEDAPIDVQTSVSGMLKQAEKELPNSHAEKLHRFDGGMIAW